MRFLLDTHVLIWLGYNQAQHFNKATLAIFNAPNNHEFFVSVASVWEMSIKATLKKPNFDINPQELIDKMQQIGIQILSIDIQHTLGVMKLPLIHNDPFDRLLITQAEQENLAFLTADNDVISYNKPFIIDVRH